MSGNDDPTLVPTPSPNPDEATLPVSNEPTDSIPVKEFGDYELLDEIARGGMGVVYRARQVSLNRVVALKMILSGQFASDSDVRRFYQEAESAANLDHSGIVPIYDIGEHDGRHFFSMKFIEGGSLADALPELRKEPKKMVKLIADVARAVHHAHQRGILHRDLKPANILLDDAGNPLVSDLGLAKQIQSDSNITNTGAVVGTPAYMPPEQAAAKKEITTAADIYSLGAILYEALTGRPPHKADSPMQTLMLVMDGDVTPPREIDSSISRALELVCMKCLDSDPERRYSSAAALADDLERWLDGSPVSVRPQSMASAFGEAILTNMRSALGAALVGIAAGIALSYFTSRVLTMDELLGNPPDELYSLFGDTVPVGRSLAFMTETRVDGWAEIGVALGGALTLWFIGLFVFIVTRPKPGSAAIAVGAVAGLLMTFTYFACLCGCVMVWQVSHDNSMVLEIDALAAMAVGSPQQSKEAHEKLNDGFPMLNDIPEDKRADALAQRIYYDGIYAVPIGILLGIAVSSLICLPTCIVGTAFASRLWRETGKWRSMWLPYFELSMVVVWLSITFCLQTILPRIDGFTVGSAHIADRWGWQLLSYLVLVGLIVLIYRRSLRWPWRLLLLVVALIGYNLL